MPEVKLPKTIAVVVQSEVLGSTAISVPAQDLSGAALDPGPHDLILVADQREVEDELDRRETAYLDSHQAKVNPFDIDRDELRRIAAKKLQDGTDNWNTIAARIGWVRQASRDAEEIIPDGERVKHLLGYRNDRPNATISAEDAEELCKGLDIDPVEVGL